MSFPDLLENPGSVHEFESTKNEFRNFWNLVKNVYEVDPTTAKHYIDVIYGGGQKRYDALKIINKSPHINNALQKLSPELLDEIQAMCGQRSQIFQALLETKDIQARHDDIKNYPHILDALNALPPTYCTNLLDQAIDPDVWLKISNIQDTGVLRGLFSNLAFGEVSYMIATGFLALIKESTTDDFAALIDLYQTTHLDIIRIVDQGLNAKTLVVDIHKLFMDKDIPLVNKQALLKGLTGFALNVPQEKLMWQQKISANVFTPSHTDIMDVLKQLLSMSQSTILMGFLELTVKFGNNGYAQIQCLLDVMLKDDLPHAILTEMNALKSDDIALMIQELVWTSQGDIFVAQKFLDFAAGLDPLALNHFLQAYLYSVRQTYVFPHLLQSIETTSAKIYPYLCGKTGVIAKDLMLELQMLDGAARNNILAEGSATLFRKLRKLEGLPFLLAGVLQMGKTEDPSEKLQERYILDSLDMFTDSGHKQQDFKNIAYAINALGNRQLTRTLVPLLYAKPLAMDRISCDDSEQGQEKSIALLNALCTPDGTIRKMFISEILDNKTMTGVMDGLLVQGVNSKWQALCSFIHVIDDQSADDSIVDQFNSFLLNDDDPYRFIRLIAQIANDTQKSEKYYSILMTQTPTERKRMIRDIMVTGKVELLFNTILRDSEFRQWEDMRQKSEPMYQALLILLAKTDDDHLQELKTLIHSTLIQTEAYKNILDKWEAQVSYQKIVRFIAELQNNPNFVSIVKEAFHEKIAQEVEAYVHLVVKLYDKGIVLESFGQLSTSQAVMLVQAFASGYDTLLDRLNQMNSVPRCTQLLKRFCQENTHNANYPVSLCSNMMECLDDASAKVLQSFIDVRNANEDKMFFDFETVMSALKSSNPHIMDHAKTLLNQHLFMFIIKLFGSEMRQKLLAEILADQSDPIGTFYLLSPNIMLPLLATYRKVGDLAKIHTLCQKIADAAEWMETLQYFVHARKDPDSKLLIAIFAASVSDNFEIDMQRIEHLHQAIEYFPNLREALFRFAARSHIYPAELFTLINYFLEEGILYTSSGKINASFGFPQKQMIVAEDHWIYDQFLNAVEFYKN